MRAQLVVRPAVVGVLTGFAFISVTLFGQAMASVEGRFVRGEGESPAGWIAGWTDLGAVLIRTTGGTAIRVNGRDGSRADVLAIADSVIGAVFPNENGSTVRLYDRGKIGILR